MSTNDEACWFACLCLDQGIMNERGLRLMLESFDDQEAVDIIAMAEKIHRSGACDDTDFLQALVHEAGYQAYRNQHPPLTFEELLEVEHTKKPWTIGDTPALFQARPSA